MNVDSQEIMVDEQVMITFIVPARNEERRIGACIKSILDADCCGFRIELIVVDNGSTDDTVQIACDLGAQVEQRPGDTISTLRNVGARMARSTYIAFIDADVLIDRSWIRHAMQAIKPDQVAMVGSSPSIPDDASWVVRTWHLQVQARPVYGKRTWLASMNILVDREIFLSVDGFDESLITCEDVDLGYRISRRHEILNDARIEAIHLGEAQTLRELFRKETWRGSSNYSGAFRHGIERGEIPSLLLPPVTLVSGVGMVIALLFYRLDYVFLFATVFFAYPLLQSVRIAKATRQWFYFPALIIIWSVYSVARVKSMFAEARSNFAVPASSRSSR